MKYWKNITLESLIEADKISKQELDQLDKQVKILSILTGRDEDYILDLPREHFFKLLKEYDNIKALPDGKVKDFRAGGYDWKPNTDISKFKNSQYIDCAELVKDKDKLIERLPDLLATICEPYKQYPLFIKVKPKLSFEEKRAALMKAKAADVYPISLFFCRVLIHLTSDIASSLNEDMKMMIAKNQMPTPNSGAGISS